MKFIKKFITVILVIIMLVASIANTASASVVGGTYSGYSKKTHNGSYSYTSFSVTITFPNGINKVRHVGSSTTKWLGSSPFNADSIVHKNIVSVSSLGGLSVSSSGGGGSISGSQMTDEMSVKNKWQINSSFDYNLKASIFIFSSNFSSSGRVQMGSNFYSMSCTT